MKHEEYFADDRCIIPDDIKRMSKEELEAEIAKLEAEIRERKLETRGKTA